MSKQENIQCAGGGCLRVNPLEERFVHEHLIRKVKLHGSKLEVQAVLWDRKRSRCITGLTIAL